MSDLPDSAPDSRRSLGDSPHSAPGSRRPSSDPQSAPDSRRTPGDPQSAPGSLMRPPVPPPVQFPSWLTIPLLILGLLLIPAAAWLMASDSDPPKRTHRSAHRGDVGNEGADEEDEVGDEEDESEVEAPHQNEPQAESAPPEVELIHGMVVSGEQVVPNAMVRCTRRGDEERVVATMGNGSFTLPLEADGCLAVAQSGRFGKSAPVEMRRGGDNRIEMPGQGSVAGVVMDERGLVIDKFLIELDHATLADGSFMPGQSQRSIDDAEGKFTLENLAAGTWTLLISAAGRPPTRIDVRVEGGKATDNVRVRLERGATLLGSVIDRATKRPIGGATVTLDEGQRQSAIQPATTSPGGDFRLEGVPDGAFSVEVRHPDYLTRIVSGLDAKGQRQVRVTIDLATAADGGGNLEMSGIGASLSANAERKVVVRSVREDGPAERAGMMADDIILTIDGQSAEGFDVQACVQLLRGPPGTDVAVTVSREGNPIGMTILRETMVQ